MMEYNKFSIEWYDLASTVKLVAGKRTIIINVITEREPIYNWLKIPMLDLLNSMNLIYGDVPWGDYLKDGKLLNFKYHSINEPLINLIFDMYCNSVKNDTLTTFHTDIKVVKEIDTRTNFRGCEITLPYDEEEKPSYSCAMLEYTDTLGKLFKYMIDTNFLRVFTPDACFKFDATHKLYIQSYIIHPNNVGHFVKLIDYVIGSNVE